MNRRTVLATAGSLAALSTGYLGARVADVRPYDPDLPTGETPRERIVAAAAHRYAADHRVVSRIRVDDGTGDESYDVGRYRGLHEHSRRRHTRVFTTVRRPAVFAPPLPGLYFLLHWDYTEDEPLPYTTVIHETDADVVASWDAPTPADVDDDPRFGGRMGTGFGRSFDPRPLDFVQPHDAEWTETDRTGSRITYELADPAGYAQVVPLGPSVTAVEEGSFLRATLESETGRLRRLVDSRDVVVDGGADGDNSTRRTPTRIRYRIETTFDRYGSVSAPRPDGDVSASAVDRAKGLLLDAMRY